MDVLYLEIFVGYYCGRLGLGLLYLDFNVGAWDCGLVGKFFCGNRIGFLGLVWVLVKKSLRGRNLYC